MVPVVHLEAVHKRPFQREFNSRWSLHDWEISIPLSDWFGRTTRIWLFDGIFFRRVPFTLPPPVAEFFTDSIQLDWGSHALGLHVSGTWDSTSATTHFNSLQLLVVLLVLRTLVSHLPISHILFRSDNETTITYINRHRDTVSHSRSVEAETLLL